MTEEQKAALLSSLKVDLGISTTAFDERLGQYLSSAEAAIRAEGATTLDPGTAQDAQLIVMYAAWTWRRRDSMEGMPRMLRYALNNRIFGEKARAGTDG